MNKTTNNQKPNERKLNAQSAFSAARCSAKCPVCKIDVEDDDALYVHVYLEHPEVHDNIDKMLKGETYETAEQLRKKGILPNESS